MFIYIEIKSLFCFPNNSLDEKWQETTQAILRCTNTFGRVVYCHIICAKVNDNLFHCDKTLSFYRRNVIYFSPIYSLRNRLMTLHR